MYLMKQLIASLLLAYFRLLAKRQLKKNNPKIIGITGSAGKTSALASCEVVLQSKYRVKTSHKANSESGIPLNILGLKPHNYSIIDWLRLALLAPIKLLTNKEAYDIYLVEMGIDGPNYPKNMTYLLSIVQPDVGIFLNANLTHSENFDYLVSKDLPAKKRGEQITRLIALEKGKIITSLPKNANAVLNLDDQNADELQNKTQATLCTFAAKGKPTIKITGLEYSDRDTKFLFKYQAKTYQLTMRDMLLPSHFGYTFAAAICCGLIHKISISQSIREIEQKFKLPPGRSTVIAGLNQSLIIDSSYNASTHPALDMLELLKNVKGKRKIALLGDLREMGESAAAAHQQVAKKAAQVCNQVNLVGPLMKEYALPILEKEKVKVTHHDSAAQAADVLKDQLHPGDVLLVKGSQNTLLLEIAVEKLMAHPEDANKFLCRRSQYWNQQRRKLM